MGVEPKAEGDHAPESSSAGAEASRGSGAMGVEPKAEGDPAPESSSAGAEASRGSRFGRVE